MLVFLINKKYSVNNNFGSKITEIYLKDDEAKY